MRRESAGTGARLAALGGLATGLAVAPTLGPVAPEPPALAGAAALIALALARLSGRSRPRRACRLAAVAAATALIGAGWGAWRVAAIDSRALDLEAGTRVTATGHLAAPPRRSSGKVRIRLATPVGRLMVEVPEPVGDLSEGAAIRASGTIRDPLPWEEGHLRRLGIRTVLAAPRVRSLDGARAGLAGWLDGVRERVEDALGRGTGDAAAGLLRGFVLGQDDRIAPDTVAEFRRSGLAHLLAVSGTNVMLLSLLAFAALGLLGVPLRARLLWTLALIAIYVPVAGAGPSIQRAGAMGAAGVIAALASRPASRGYALLVAAVATLALNPRACGEVGWQLSFAAVAGILVWAGRIRELLQRPGARSSPIRRAAAEGAGLTIAATVATAPLMAHHFDAFSITSLPANLLALPAVAPTMWLGMTAGAAGQVPGLPVEPVTAAAGAFAAYIGQVGAWMARPDWALFELQLESPAGIALAYALLGGALTCVLRWWRRRRSHGPRPAAAAAALASGAVVLALLAPSALESFAAGAGGPGHPRPGGLLVSVLDVGQGDAILLDPGDGDPVLVDAGPPAAGVAAQLHRRGIERLGALIVTHPDSDHAGGVAEVLAALPTGLLAQARAERSLVAAARAAGARTTRLAAGDVLRSGSLRLEVVWPPARLVDLGWGSREPNRLSLVLVARFRGFRMLLTGDAEAEVTPLDPGSIDVLKVAHHGSADAGLESLLARAAPVLGVISAGEGNPFGHPAPETLDALARSGVATMRTDTDGELRIDVGRDGWEATATR